MASPEHYDLMCVQKVMNIWDAFKMLEEIVDESDPDIDAPQVYMYFFFFFPLFFLYFAFVLNWFRS
jgi:hypothetical protein